MKTVLLVCISALTFLSSCKKDCYFCQVGGVTEKVCDGNALYTPISKGWPVYDGTTGEEYKCK
ncbi:MAG TPA: hypothetical protein VK174_06305 [Chitinophagales bacterium]|nr:hypothetical protein [Chitinophagales bacterium]